MAEPRMAGGILLTIRTLFSPLMKIFGSPLGIAILSLTAIFVVGISGMIYERYLSSTESIPEPGGTHIEGILGNRSQFADITKRLTLAGLISLTKDRQFIPVLAESWTLSPDGKTYTFNLRKQVSSEEIARVAKDQDLFKTVTVETPDPQTVIFRLKQPFGPFLAFLSLPLFSPGPYTLTGELENELTFSANPSFPLGSPYLDQITVRMYKDSRALKQAASRRAVTAAVTEEKINGWYKFESLLPRSIQTVFNLDREEIADLSTRQKLLAGETLPESKSLTLVTTPQLKSYAEDLRSRWAVQNVAITVQLAEDAAMRQTVIPEREYDVLIYGVDGGAEPDPYRFWHSSQTGSAGLNLAQLKDKEMDSLLENARQIVDDEKRYQKYQEIEQRLTDLAIRLVLGQVSITYQISPTIKGVEQPFMTNMASRYNFSWKWYTKERRVLKE